MPKLTVKVEWPDGIQMSRDNLSDILAEVMFAPDESLLSPLALDATGRDRYDGGKFEGTHYSWKVTP